MHGTWARRLVAGITSTLLAAAGLVALPATAQAAVPDSFRISGSGFGHGVGMPQFGAYELARRGGVNGGDVLRHYYKGATTQHVTTPQIVAVQVYGPDPLGRSGYGDTKDTSAVAVHDGSWRLRTSDGKTLLTGSGTTRFSLSTASGKIVVKVDGKTYRANLLRIHWSGTRYYRSDGTQALATVRDAHGTYKHGRMTLSARQGIPNVVNDVLLNTEYLYGIAEMPSSWGVEGSAALRAQAMAARSYALVAMRSAKTDCRCHVVDDVRDQNFTGWKKENEGTNGRWGKVWKKAVNASVASRTRAQALTYAGSPVQAHYYSSSGGRTADSEDVWVSRIPYERSVSDPYSKAAPGNSYASWTRTITQAQARRLFGLTNVQSIAVTARWTSGQVRTLTATKPNGTKASITGKADAMRSKIGARTTAGSMPASWITRVTAVS
ncbi:SpoIID/LytB domain-containing protein [Isoptericola cucumis]|uniref:Sporulation stage II protein D amidase enhancer LytB N-terminal domain-containing protein n=1 Tax=Isoptericola cucumis TaxID=1776856 RepID=A0ABQ2B946_9MICO|nr:SpoIID/LytB domain-containing protein [Isoptericola cucumis]GGI09856.1 hypothetical protein GCM10007368_28290 [Isoptericola cucumis]